MKKIITGIIAVSLVFAAVQSANAADVTAQSDSNAKTVIAIANKYKKGERMSLIDSFSIRNKVKPRMKTAGFLDTTQNFTVSKNIAIYNPGAYTFKFSGTLSQTSGIFTTTDRYSLSVVGSAPVGKTFIKPTSITINFYDYNFVVSALPPMITKQMEVSRTVTCSNTSQCSLIGSTSYSDLSTVGYVAAEMIINYPTVSYTFAADVR